MGTVRALIRWLSLRGGGMQPRTVTCRVTALEAQLVPLSPLSEVSHQNHGHGVLRRPLTEEPMAHGSK